MNGVRKSISILVYAFVCTVLLVVHAGSAMPTIDQREAHCPYEETVDITESILLPNGSYLYRGHLIPSELTGYYDYEILYYDEVVPVARHLRGCICEVTSCVQFCCHPQASKVKASRECSMSENAKGKLNYSPFVNITDDHGEMRQLNAFDELFIQQRLPCDRGYVLENGWELLMNGTLHLFDNDSEISVTKHDYCLMPEEFDGERFLVPLLCFRAPKPTQINVIVNFSLMLISLPLMVATICVYACIRELRLLHGKCLIAYLASMGLGDIFLNSNTLATLLDKMIPVEWCFLIGCVTLFLHLSAFFWLSINSFDLWYNIRGTSTPASPAIQQRRFYVYCLVATLGPGILTAATMWAQVSDLNPAFKPGIGEDSCWVDVTKWSAMIYFYGPMMILISYNSTMFTLTYLKIYRVQKELSRFRGKKESNRHLRSQRDDVALFTRLFVIMGVIWIFEILSYFAGTDSVYFYATDAVNSAIGIIIFVLFVLKRRVLMLIRMRLCAKTGKVEIKAKGKHSTRSTNGHESGISLTQNTDI